MVRRLGLGKNNHLTNASLALNLRVMFKGNFSLDSARLVEGKECLICTDLLFFILYLKGFFSVHLFQPVYLIGKDTLICQNHMGFMILNRSVFLCLGYKMGNIKPKKVSSRLQECVDSYHTAHACATYHLGLSSLLIHSIVANDSGRGQQRP